jgi:hypothetical protein
MAARKIAQTEPANPDAHQFFHFVANFIKHPANLAIDSLAEEDSQPRRFNGMNGLDPGALSVEHHALV